LITFYTDDHFYDLLIFFERMEDMSLGEPTMMDWGVATDEATD
jgi:hypothetical protein